MRILVNAVGARVGGGARHLVPFLDALVRQRPGWEVVVCIGRGDESAVERAEAVELVAATGTGILSRLEWDARGAAALARQRNASAILNLTNYGPVVPRRPSVLFQRNPIYFDPSWIRRISPKRRLVARVRRQLAYAELARSSAVVTPTRAMMSYLHAWPHASLPKRTEVIAHAVDTDRFSFREPRSRPANQVTLLTVANAAPHKGVETAIGCVARLKRLGIAAELMLTISPSENGSGQRYVDGLLGYARKLKVEGQIEWLGARSDVEHLYHQAHMLLLPSFTESFGFPLVEAMASGTPIVASAIPSSIEVAGTTAVYFVPGDSATAAAQVIEVLGQGEALSSAAAKEGRARAEAMSWPKNAAAVARLLEEVGDAQRPSSF